MQLRNYKTVQDRREAVEKELTVDLSASGSFTTLEEQASSRNCENMVGFTSVPLGIAGPLLLAKDQAYHIPLATTEGALVASVSRGCKAITQSGGANTRVEKVGISRAPVFRVKGIEEGASFIAWIEKHQKELGAVAQTTSSHLTLLNTQTWMNGREVFVRFSFDSTDAMGMNMATIATSQMVQFIKEQTGISCVAVSGNMCVDKKPNFLNFTLGRGYKVWADCVIPDKIIETVLKSSASRIFEVAQKKIVSGSLLSGTIGANAHIANVLAAFFLATGQDIAHIAECSMGVTSVEKIDEGLYISVYLPDMVVGTVGGGTGLATQKEALSLLKLDSLRKGEQAKKLAEIMAAAALAGEISLLSSLSEGSLATAHTTLARGSETL